MPRPLGSRQLESLITLARPGSVMLTPDAVERSLLALGLLSQPEGRPGTMRITPAGLRRLADELEAGRVDAVLAEQNRRWIERQEQRRGKG